MAVEPATETEATARRDRFWNVPNSLTVSRLGLAVVVFALIAGAYYSAALVTFAVASLTDALDGYFARRLGQASAIGRQLDPLVDKVIVIGTLVYLLPLPFPRTGLAPWMVAAVVTRELIVSALRSLIEGRGEPFGARMAGKLKTCLQCFSIGAILLLLTGEWSSAWAWARDGLTWAAVGLTIYSGFGYLILAWPKIRSGSAPGT